MGMAAAATRVYCTTRRKSGMGAKGCAATARNCFAQRRKGTTGAKTIALCIFEKIMGVVVEIWKGWSIFGGRKKIIRSWIGASFKRIVACIYELAAILGTTSQ